MIETMPESNEVETFKNLIGPFYEDSTGVGFKQEGTDVVKHVRFEEKSPVLETVEDSDDNELEFEDSFDDLTSTTPQTGSMDSLWQYE
jgi:hypothetical protein